MIILKPSIFVDLVHDNYNYRFFDLFVIPAFCCIIHLQELCNIKKYNFFIEKVLIFELYGCF